MSKPVLTDNDLLHVAAVLHTEASRNVALAQEALSLLPPEPDDRRMAEAERSVTFWLAEADRSLSVLAKLWPHWGQKIQTASAEVLLSLDKVRNQRRTARVS